MPNFGLCHMDACLNEAIVHKGPIRTVVTLARIERHLTVLHSFPLDLDATRSSFFRNCSDSHDKSRTASQVGS